ncbi:MAG: efflux RND transporter periplasmic adaptor subunit [candidate division Zixibacteria bacterium]|nr:efflux RND transporter periplasmic adaptor subunit [candidate division Zixibacteria bacterium]
MSVLILVAGFLSMWALLSLKTGTPKRPPEVRTKIVETAIVQLQPVQTRIITYGRVTSTQPVMFYAEVAGTLQPGTVPFKPAQSFSKGDLLVKIDDRQARLNLNSTLSDLMTALATVLPEIKVDFPDEYQVWQDYFNSCQFDKKIAPLPETSNPKVKLYLSRFNVYKLYFSVCNLEILLDKHYFYAPFDGSIVSASLRVGSSVRVGTLLGEIINLEQMEVGMPVEAKDIRWIDQQQLITFASTEIPGEWTGSITRIGSDIDTRTQTVQIYVSMNNEPGTALLNGTFLEARILGHSIDNAYAVPPRAIYEDRYVYLITDGKLERRPVTIIRREPDRIIIDGGVKNGDTLVVEIMQGVAPGMPASSRTMTTENRGH